MGVVNYCYVASARRRARHWGAHGGGEGRGHIVSPRAQLVCSETTILKATTNEPVKTNEPVNDADKKASEPAALTVALIDLHVHNTSVLVCISQECGKLVLVTDRIKLVCDASAACGVHFLTAY